MWAGSFLADISSARATYEATPYIFIIDVEEQNDVDGNECVAKIEGCGP